MYASSNSAGLLLEFLVRGLRILRQVLGQLDTLLLGNLFQLVVGLPVFIGYPVTEVLYLSALCLLLSKRAQPYLHEPALRSLRGEVPIHLCDLHLVGCRVRLLSILC
jgi:hypothetical protein